MAGDNTDLQYPFGKSTVDVIDNLIIIDSNRKSFGGTGMPPKTRQTVFLYVHHLQKGHLPSG